MGSLSVYMIIIIICKHGAQTGGADNLHISELCGIQWDI